MKKFLFVLLFCCIFFVGLAQDSTLIGRFAVGVLGGVTKSNVVGENTKGGYTLQFRYFPSPKVAIVITHQNNKTEFLRYDKASKGSNGSLSFGFEKHFPISKFSPYAGLEVGINFVKVRSHLLTAPANIKYYQNNLPLYLIKPKLGVMYTINENLLAHMEGSFNWTFSTDRANSNPLFDEASNVIYFGRKVPVLSVGVHFLFNE